MIPGFGLPITVPKLNSIAITMVKTQGANLVSRMVSEPLFQSSSQKTNLTPEKRSLSNQSKQSYIRLNGKGL